MYGIPAISLLLMATIALLWSPLVALIAAGSFFALFLVYAGLRPRIGRLRARRRGGSSRRPADR